MATNTKTRNRTSTAADVKADTGMPVNGKPGNGTSEKAAKIAGLPRERVADVLAGKPDGATAREIAGETKLAQSTVTTALKALKQDGTVVCLPGRSKDNPRTADVWRTATTTGTPGPGSDEPTGSSPEPVADDTAEAPTPENTNTGPTADEPADAKPNGADDVPATESTESTADDTDPDTADSDGPPVMTEADRFRLLVVVSYLGDEPDGISAADLVDRTQLNPRYLSRMLAAMEVAGAAHRLPPDESGTELWQRGEADPATVDLANAPTHTTCPTCGQKRRIAVNVTRASRGSGEPGVNSDGAAKLEKGELRNLVRQYINARPEEIHTAGSIARGIEEETGRTVSPGAVRNNLSYLITKGEIEATDEDGKEVTAATGADKS